MYDGESEPDGEGDEAATYVHVVLVRHGKDDDQQQERAEDLVRCQGVKGNLFGSFPKFSFYFLEDGQYKRKGFRGG